MIRSDCEPFLFVGRLGLSKTRSLGIHQAQLCAYKLPELELDGWTVQGVDPDDLALLRSGVCDKLYFSTWAHVLQSAHLVDRESRVWVLSENIGVWLVPEGMEWNPGLCQYVWPEEIL